MSNITRGSVRLPDADSFGLFLAYPLFLKPVTETKKFHDVRKSGDVQQTKWFIQKVLFYYEDFVYQASEL